MTESAVKAAMKSAFANAADAIDAPEQFATPFDLANEMWPGTNQTPALALIDRKLIDVAEGRCKRLMIFMPPQEGKSERASHTFPLWQLLKNPDKRIVIASYDKATAERWGRDIRTDIYSNSGEDGARDLGLRLRTGSKSAGRWTLQGSRGGIYCVGVGGALTGRPADLMIIDDPVKGRKDAESKAIQKDQWNWWTGTARTRLGPGAAVILIMTRWHESDLAGMLLATQGTQENSIPWEVVSIPAQCEDPESDSLHRELDEYMESARRGEAGEKRTEKDWLSIEEDVGAQDWAALYQQRPAPAAGNIFKREWWLTYDVPRAVRTPDGSMRVLSPGQVFMSWDMAFKDTDRSDYVVGQVWQKRGLELVLLDQVRGRMDFTATCQAFQALCAKWPQAGLKIVEDKANGPAVISQLRSVVAGIVPYTPVDSKEGRAHASAPFIQAHNVSVPSPMLAPWVGDFLEECSAFPNCAHDDQVDAMTQAITRMLLTAGGVNNFMEQLVKERGLTMIQGGRHGAA